MLHGIKKERTAPSFDSTLCLSCPLQKQRVNSPSPVAELKAVKNEAEIKGMKNAHVGLYECTNIRSNDILKNVCTLCLRDSFFKKLLS